MIVRCYFCNSVFLALGKDCPNCGGNSGLSEKFYGLILGQGFITSKTPDQDRNRAMEHDDYIDLTLARVMNAGWVADVIKAIVRDE